MHIFETTAHVDAGPLHLNPGKYVAEDYNVAHYMLNSGRGNFRVSPIDLSEKFITTDQNVLVIKPGAYGDLLLATPAFREMKRLNPNCRITLAAMPNYSAVSLFNRDIDEIIDYPVPFDKLVEYDRVIAVENAIEGRNDSGEHHACDLLAEKIGVKLSDRSLVYEVTKDEKAWAAARYERTDKKRVCVQLTASTPCRDYPGHLLTEVVLKLLTKDIEVFVVGHPYQSGAKSDKLLHNCTAEGLNIRQSIAAMQTCDVLLAPDSVMIHAASALGIKTVGLFGPVHWSNRATSDKLYAIQGSKECKPCNHVITPKHGAFPTHCPSKEKGFCALLASIPVERVIAKVELALK